MSKRKAVEDTGRSFENHDRDTKHRLFHAFVQGRHQHTQDDLHQKAANGFRTHEDKGGSASKLVGWHFVTTSVEDCAYLVCALAFSGQGRALRSVKMTLEAIFSGCVVHTPSTQMAQYMTYVQEANTTANATGAGNGTDAFGNILHPTYTPNLSEAPAPLLRLGHVDGYDLEQAVTTNMALPTVVLASELEQLLRSVVREEVAPVHGARMVLESYLATLTENAELRVVAAAARAESAVLVRMTRKQQAFALTAEQRLLAETVQNEVTVLRQAATSVATTLLPCQDAKPDQLQLVGIQAATKRSGAPFDSTCFLATQAYELLRTERTISPARLANIMMQVVHVEHQTAGHDAAEHTTNSHAYAPAAFAKIEEQIKRSSSAPSHATVVGEMHAWQATRGQVKSVLDDMRVEGEANTVTFIIDLMTTCNGSNICLAGNHGQPYDDAPAAILLQPLSLAICKALKSQQGMHVHLLLLGCNTLAMIDNLKVLVTAELTKDAAASASAEDCFWCATRDKFPGGLVAMVILFYGLTGWRGVAGSLSAHESATKLALKEWGQMYEADSDLGSDANDLSALEDVCVWGRL